MERIAPFKPIWPQIEVVCYGNECKFLEGVRSGQATRTHRFPLICQSNRGPAAL